MWQHPSVLHLCTCYGHPAQQMRTLYFAVVVSSSFFFLIGVFSSPILSSRRLDVYHTSTHDVALVQIQNAGMKCAACSSLKIQDANNRHLRTITQLCRAISSQLRHILTIGKKNLLNSNIPSPCPHSMVKVGLLMAEIDSVAWGTPADFNGFRVLASLLQRRCSTKVNQTLHGVWPSPGLLHYICTFGVLAP